MKLISKQAKAKRRAARVRAKVSGTASRPRVSASVSLTGLFVQFIDDKAGKTLLSGRSHKSDSPADKTAQARVLGEALVKQAKAVGITTIVFDRGAKQYHGRVQALAEALRQGGLIF